MDHTLKEAATLTGKSVRQLRYLLKQGHLKARKVGGQWVISDADLPRSEAQEYARRRRQERAMQIAEEVLQPPQKTYSVTDLRAFETARSLFGETTALFSESHQVPTLLRDAMLELCCGCHAYHHRQKASHFKQAREHLCHATVYLFLDAKGESLGHRLEQDLLSAVAGLIRRVEGKRR